MYPRFHLRISVPYDFYQPVLERVLFDNKTSKEEVFLFEEDGFCYLITDLEWLHIAMLNSLKEKGYSLTEQEAIDFRKQRPINKSYGNLSLLSNLYDL